MLGFDTGFFMQLLQGDALPVETRRNAMQNKVSSICSCLTLFELERLSLKGVIEDHSVLCEGIHAVCKVVWLDTAILSMGSDCVVVWEFQQWMALFWRGFCCPGWEPSTRRIVISPGTRPRACVL